MTIEIEVRKIVATLMLFLTPGLLFALTGIVLVLFDTFKSHSFYYGIIEVFDMLRNINAYAWLFILSWGFILFYFKPIILIFITLFILRKIKINHMVITVLVSGTILISWYFCVIYSESHHLKYGMIYIAESIASAIFVIPYFEKILFEKSQ